MSELKNTYTFWELIENYRIVIPIIQRDYVQGRADEEDKREDFLEALYQAIIAPRLLHLDFIYGSSEDDKLYPLDGQQRLTTLFLLHWYFAMKEEKIESVRDTLLRFSYATRTSTRDFCEFIVNLDDVSFGVDIVDSIKDKYGYYYMWDQDPSISSMLRMICAINSKFEDVSNAFDLLISNDSPITFNFLDIEKYALKDELYIKMNARGKPLSIFENFKAKFIQVMSEKGLPYDHFEHSIDSTWTDLLWDYRSNDNTMDKEFMNLFAYFTEMIYLEFETEDVYEQSPFRSTRIKELIEMYDTEDKLDLLYKLFDYWKDRKEIESVLSSLFSVSRTKGKIRLFGTQTSNIAESIIKGKSVGLQEKIIFYSLMRRRIYFSSIYKEDHYEAEYLRIIRNLIIDSRSFNKKDCKYASDFRYGRQGSPYMRFIIDELMCSPEPYITIMNTSSDLIKQKSIASERRKYGLISDGQIAFDDLGDIEDTSVFHGCLDNVFSFLEEIESYDSSIPNEVDQIFTKKNFGSVIKALLSIGDYRIKVGSSFCGDRYFYGDINDWHSIITYDGGDNYTQIITSFFNMFFSLKGSCEERLAEIVKLNADKFNYKNYEYYLLKYPAFISDIRVHPDKLIYAWDNGDMAIHRLGSTTFLGYHVIPVYLEAVSRIHGASEYAAYGLSGEDMGCVKLKSGVELSFSEKQGIDINYDEDKISNESVSEIIDNYHSQIETRDYDYVERFVLLGSLINDYFENQETTVT